MKKLLLALALVSSGVVANAGINVVYGCWGGRYFMADVKPEGGIKNLHIFGPCDHAYISFGKVVSTGDLPGGVGTDPGTEAMLNNLDLANSTLVSDPETITSLSDAITGNDNSTYINIDNITNPDVKAFLSGY